MHTGEIRFYRASEKPYGGFSNLYRRKIVFEGEEYPTSEHAYQAGKARKPEVKAWLMQAPSPALLAMAAHGLYYWDIAPNWSRTKFDRMRRVLRAKFDQHDDLRSLLMSTGDARLVESTTVDNEVNRTWGEVNGRGQNMLGKMLMELRADLRAGVSGVDSLTVIAQEVLDSIDSPISENTSGPFVPTVFRGKVLSCEDAREDIFEG